MFAIGDVLPVPPSAFGPEFTSCEVIEVLKNGIVVYFAQDESTVELKMTQAKSWVHKAQMPKGAATSSSGASAPPPSGDSPGEKEEPEPEKVGGKRKVKPTVMMVNGFAVKRQNMYDMEEGEGSVWDRELSTKSNDAFAAKDRSEHRPVPKPSAPRVQKPKEAVPREVSSEEASRLKRNDELRAAQKEALAKRTAFFQPHAAILERFGCKLPPLVKAPPNGGFFEDPSVTPPPEIQVEMREYQKRGLRWLSAMHSCGANAILADEMGLGKTLQTIAFLAHLKFHKGIEGPHLVIAPLSVLSSWMSELKRFCPALRAIKLHSSDAEERKRLITTLAQRPGEYDVVVTTFEMAKSPNVTTATRRDSNSRHAADASSRRPRSPTTVPMPCSRLLALPQQRTIGVEPALAAPLTWPGCPPTVAGVGPPQLVALPRRR